MTRPSERRNHAHSRENPKTLGHSPDKRLTRGSRDAYPRPGQVAEWSKALPC